MRTKINLVIAATLMLVITSCKKDTCATCSISTNAPGASQNKTYCGSDYEIAKEDTRLKNECEQLKADYPQYLFACGCD